MSGILFGKEPHLPSTPTQNVQLSLIRPVFNSRNKLLADRIHADVVPFVRVSFIGAQLPVPMIRLPQWAFFGARPVPCCDGFPEANPVCQRTRIKSSWRTEEMDMVRHQDVTPDKSFVRLSAGTVKNLVCVVPRQNRLTVRGAHGDENDGGFLQSLNDRWMCRMPA
jgi:hypothetical protein